MDKGSMLSHNHVYALYNDVAVANPVLDTRLKNYFKYIDDLVNIEKENECRAVVQDYENWKLCDLLDHARNARKRRHVFPLDLLERVRLLAQDQHMLETDARVWFANDFTATFFHFIPYQAGAPCTQRVYANVKGEDALKVMKFIVNS